MEEGKIHVNRATRPTSAGDFCESSPLPEFRLSLEPFGGDTEQLPELDFARMRAFVGVLAAIVARAAAS